jgi:hypothetical protein
MSLRRRDQPALNKCTLRRDLRVLLHALRYWTCFRRFRGRWVPFSYFLRPDSFSAVPRASAPVFMFCPPELVFGGTEGVRSRFHVFVTGHIFGGVEGVRTRFHILPSRTHFRRYRGRRYRQRRVLFSCFALPDSFSVVPRAPSPVFMLCSPGFLFSAV